MPRYEYECEKGHLFSIEQSIKSEALKKCIYAVGGAAQEGLEFCGAPCRRLISKTSFTFKGGAPTPKFH
jgi:predicted nucleic acid-binding Zn ribbon protein